VKALGNHQKQLETNHATLCASLGIQQEGIDIQNDADIISDLIKEKQDAFAAREAEWTTERAELLASADALKIECSQLQEQVRL